MYRELYEGAILHDKADDVLLDMIRDQQHVYIEWKTNLQWLMKQDFVKTNSCDFSLGTFIIINYCTTIIFELNFTGYSVRYGKLFLAASRFGFPQRLSHIRES